jgi:predicted nucleic acid-binding protein
MKEPVFIDSNIWLYSFLKQDEKKRKIAKRLIKSIKPDTISISTQIINEVCFNLKRNNFPELEIKEIASSFSKISQSFLSVRKSYSGHPV